MNRCSSLLSGVASSYALAFWLGLKPPTTTELIGVGLIVAALGTMMASTLAARRRGPTVPQRVYLFVCGGNTSRSPMAQAICNAELARRLGLDGAAVDVEVPVLALSAGLRATPGKPFTAPANA